MYREHIHLSVPIVVVKGKIAQMMIQVLLFFVEASHDYSLVIVWMYFFETSNLCVHYLQHNTYHYLAN